MLDYRPDYQLPVGQLLALLCVLKARRGKRNAGVWHLLCGLIAVLTMQLHAAGIIVAFSFGVLYVVSAVWQAWHGEAKREIAADMLWFGAGAVLGVLIYYVANIASIGGLNVYLDQLVGERGAGGRPIKAFVWPSAYEAAFILAALASYALHLRRAQQFPLLFVL
ncbi:hypothetical protein HC776_01085, partial [bacterium]|nr:hypothetical protein [bacterium]